MEKVLKVGDVVETKGNTQKVYKGLIKIDGVKYKHFDLIKVDKDGKPLNFVYVKPLIMDLHKNKGLVVETVAIEAKTEEKRVFVADGKPKPKRVRA